MTPDSIEPDTKDWTWVLSRPCVECGFDAAAVEPSAVHDLIRRVPPTGSIGCTDQVWPSGPA